MQPNENPLARHFRQPKLYISLPSHGNFYQSGSFEKTETGEYPVLAMTAKDELRFKTPDALLNGQATVDVIQSCMPNIKNGWMIPSIDLDAILIAIRIATYGEHMDITTVVPNTEIERTYSVDLRQLLDQITSQSYENAVTTDDFLIEISPLTYKNFTETALKTFEEQRLFKLLDNNEISEVEKIQKFNESFNRLTNMNLNIVTNSIVSVKYQDEQPVTDTKYIEEFFENSDKGLFKSVLNHVDAQREKFKIKPLVVATEKEDIASGGPKTFEVPITFDQSDFFAKGS